ncbi:hypothetical protein [Burkholderia aenigmatica]|uniref:hypothetical protein n=1 Tax=Burkholderia aenigmatica TaxID=2015348 RepID=UPI002655AEF3|nr:hypothetical protein [Burkholderia aenigmatica]MDN7874339.1 hypothetical protein [Burkholderia aenigmatica]
MEGAACSAPPDGIGGRTARHSFRLATPRMLSCGAGGGNRKICALRRFSAFPPWLRGVSGGQRARADEADMLPWRLRQQERPPRSMGYGKRDRDISATYCRSYLVTLGAAFAGGSAFVLSAAPAGNWPGWGIGLLAAFLIGGVLLVAIGLFGSERFVRRCAESASGHEATLIVMAVAYPVYLLLRLVYDRR